MQIRWVLLLLAMFAASPASAERLQFDHRLYPPLQSVLDGGDKGMVAFDNSKPGRLVDFIAVKGKSARNWSEAFEIVALSRPRDISDVRDWMALIRKQADQRCPNTITVIAEDENSVTFDRHSPKCPTERSENAIYRLVVGKRSWFQLTVLLKEAIEPRAREQWLALLASARLD